MSSSENEIPIVSATGGRKNQKEARFDLIPAEAIWWLAVLYGRGAAKYGEEHNWRRGYNWSLSFAAAMRHMWKFWRGEDMDPEMGVPHTVCAAFHMFGLTTFMEIHPEFDDRPGKAVTDGRRHVSRWLARRLFTKGSK